MESHPSTYDVRIDDTTSNPFVSALAPSLSSVSVGVFGWIQLPVPGTTLGAFGNYDSNAGWSQPQWLYTSNVPALGSYNELEDWPGAMAETPMSGNGPTSAEYFVPVYGAAFAGGSLLVGAGLAASGATSAGSLTSMIWDQPTTVIGRLPDVSSYYGNAAYNALNLPPEAWNPTVNEAWLQSSIDSGQSVMLTSDLTSSNFYNAASTYNGGFTVLGLETGQLVTSGYELVGSFFVPPVP